MLGSHVDLLNGRVRVYGLPWQGAATTRTMEGLTQALEAQDRRRSCGHRVPGAYDAYRSRQRGSTYSGSSDYGPVSAAPSLCRLPGTWVMCINLTNLMVGCITLARLRHGELKNLPGRIVAITLLRLIPAILKAL